MSRFMDIAKLKLNTVEKSIVQVIYRKTKAFIMESNLIGEPVQLTATEVSQALKDDFSLSINEMSWSVQLLLDLELINRTENKIELTQKGRLYGAFMAKDIQFTI